MGGNTEGILVDIPADMLSADVSLANVSTANTSTSDMTEINISRSDTLMANTAEDLATTNVSVACALSGLSPHTDYVITVEANTSAGYGNRSEELHIQTSRQCVSLVVCVCVCVCVCMCVCVCLCVCV